ncbi:MAG TPA: hypothetical protein VEL31_14535 [Ktedonobacteraceae bacterium]|nr:hypothetical protein [Ktedonobacteraceae bacterium]
MMPTVVSEQAPLPAILAPLLGSLIIAITNSFGQTVLGYRLVFAAATLFLILAAIFVLFVRERREIQPTVARQRSARRRVNIGWSLAFQTRSGKARGFLRFWPFWEWLMRRLVHVHPIPHAPHNLMAIALTRYSGRPIDLPDGIHVQSGDPIIELHFNNQELLSMAEHPNAWEYMHMIARNLHSLAVWMQQPDFPADAGKIRAIYGVTLLSRGARRLGFTVRGRPRNLHSRLERFFLLGLLVLYSPRGRSRLLQGTTYGTYPQETWMSPAELFKRYSDLPEPQEQPGGHNPA